MSLAEELWALEQERRAVVALRGRLRGEVRRRFTVIAMAEHISDAALRLEYQKILDWAQR